MEEANDRAMPDPNMVDLTTRVDERLLAAVKRGDAEEVERLLGDVEVNPNGRDEDGWTSLHHTAYSGDLVCAQLLLQSGADIIAAIRSNGRSAIHLASCSQQVDSIEFLLERGAFIEAEDSKGWTPLHCAVDNLKSRSVAVLLQHGADKEAKDREGKTPLHIAAARGVGITKQLVEAGATNDVRDNSGKKPSDYASEHLKDVLEGRAVFDSNSPARRSTTATSTTVTPTIATAAPAANSIVARLSRLEDTVGTNSQGNIRARIIKLENEVMGRNNTGNIPRRLELLEEETGVLDGS